MSTVRFFYPPIFIIRSVYEPLHILIRHKSRIAQSRFLVSGSADNTLRLWDIQSGKCLYSWEFPTAVKRVAFSEDDNQVVCVTEQRMGYQGAIRVFNINREGDGRDRASYFASFRGSYS